MAIRSMTGFAQVRGQTGEQGGFTLSLKSVNHRFLDLHLRVPADLDALEVPLRRRLKERLVRGHIELVLSLDRAGAGGMTVNRELAGGFIRAFRDAAREFGLSGEPDLNTILRLPGALVAVHPGVDGSLEAAALRALEEALARLDKMRLEEGSGIERELRERTARLRRANSEMEPLRAAVSRACFEKVESRMRELIGSHADRERILQEAALLASRSDIQEEIARMETHVQHFLGLLDQGGETGKKLDFLLQEMNRETNTLLSKTSGVSGEGLRITELGLEMKSEIEKLREQVQNVE